MRKLGTWTRLLLVCRPYCQLTSNRTVHKLLGYSVLCCVMTVNLRVVQGDREGPGLCSFAFDLRFAYILSAL